MVEIKKKNNNNNKLYQSLSRRKQSDTEIIQPRKSGSINASNSELNQIAHKDYHASEGPFAKLTIRNYYQINIGQRGERFSTVL